MSEGAFSRHVDTVDNLIPWGYLIQPDKFVAIDDFMPSVSFGINLGEKYSYVDFDYDRYRELVSHMAEGDEEIELSQLSITVKDSKLKLLDGMYLQDEQKMTTRTRKPSRKKSAAQLAASNIIHETQHAVDFARLREKDPKNFGENVMVLGNLSTIIGYIGFLTYSVSAVSEITTGSGATVMVIGGAMFITGGTGSHFLYHRSIREVRARQAQEDYEHFEDLLTLEPK